MFGIEFIPSQLHVTSVLVGAFGGALSARTIQYAIRRFITDGVEEATGESKNG